MTKIKTMHNNELIAEWKMIDNKIKAQQSYGKFELNYRAELEDEIRKRGLQTEC